ncbi:MAG: protein translocase subunit SecF [Patescibacteria group bacterium]|jgi:preprotein translocase subunit SecF
MSINIVKLRPLWFGISMTAVVLSVVFTAMWGLKQGIEFTGGSLLTVRFENRPNPVDAQRALESLDLGTMTVQPVGDMDMTFRLQTVDEDTHQNILSSLSGAYGTTTELQFNSIGPTVGKELREKSIYAIIVTFLAILAYIAWAFRKVSAPVESWKYGIVTIMQAFRDAMIPIGVFAFLGHFYGVEVGTPFIAAILTVVGYTITDCIVVMDRIRENLQRKSGTFESIVELSIHQTLLRSFNTSMATLLTLFAIFFFGGPSLHDFTLALIIGIAVGTYSSIFISAPTLVTIDEWSRKRKNKK